MKTIKIFAILLALVTSIQAMPKNLALDGYCPVCYIAAGKANKGDAKFAAEHNSKTYYFVSEETKQLFIANPEKFLPQYDGYCAYGMSLGKKFVSDPTVFTVVEDKVYLNKDASISKLFQQDRASHIVKADSHWKAEMMKVKDNVALDGYCPVCYIAAGKANKGDSKFAAKHNEKTYYFVSEETKQLFIANPEKFLPQYDGYCAYGMSLGKKFVSDPTVFTVVEDKVYLNKDASISKLFQEDRASHIAKADTNWKAEMQK